VVILETCYLSFDFDELGKKAMNTGFWRSILLETQIFVPSCKQQQQQQQPQSSKDQKKVGVKLISGIFF